MVAPFMWFDKLIYEKRGHVVMPENAGIQRGEGPPPPQPWIPAYAGMTVDGCPAHMVRHDHHDRDVSGTSTDVGITSACRERL